MFSKGQAPPRGPRAGGGQGGGRVVRDAPGGSRSSASVTSSSHFHKPPTFHAAFLFLFFSASVGRESTSNLSRCTILMP